MGRNARVQHSLNLGSSSKSPSRVKAHADFNTIAHTTTNAASHWRKQNLMQKAQMTINEIHESARRNQHRRNKKFERVVASAGTQGVGELDTSGTEDDITRINVDLQGGADKNLNNPRHSMNVPESAELTLTDKVVSIYRSKPSNVEDSMISAPSSIAETVMNSFTQFDSNIVGGPSNLPQSQRQNHRFSRHKNARGHTIGASRTRHG